MLALPRAVPGTVGGTCLPAERAGTPVFTALTRGPLGFLHGGVLTAVHYKHVQLFSCYLITQVKSKTVSTEEVIYQRIS